MASDQSGTTPALACTGCGSRWADAEIAKRRAADGVLSCCPDPNKPLPLCRYCAKEHHAY